jgi:F0F1-type ATP synthase membrane subunit b/b'
MLPMMLYHFLTIASSLTVICFVIYYTARIHAKEKELDAKRHKIDMEYHKIVDNALSKERKILDDATTEADKIISDTNYVATSSKDTLDKALHKMVEDFEKDSNNAGHDVMNSYQTNLKVVTDSSLKNFEQISKELETDLQKQLKAFNDAQLANMEKTIEEYKKNQFEQTKDMVGKIVKQVSEEVLNKSISVEEHQKLVIDSFEKAKKDGLFD